MEKIITLKVDLENPDEARHTIDELVKMYEEDKPQAAAETGDGRWRVQKRCQQGAVDGKIHQLVL